MHLNSHPEKEYSEGSSTRYFGYGLCAGPSFPYSFADVVFKGKTHYTSNLGLIELRRAISKYVEKNFAVSYVPKNNF